MTKNIFLVLMLSVLLIGGCKNHKSNIIGEHDLSKIFFREFTDDEVKNAIEQLSRDIDNHDTSAYFFRGMFYRHIGEYDKAKADFDFILEHDSSNSDAYYGLGMIYSGRLDSAKAIYEFNKSIKCNPQNAFAYFGRGINQSNRQKELEDYEKAIKLRPDCAQFYVWRGIRYDSMDSTDLAINDLEKSVKMDTTITLAYSFLGIIYSYKGNYDKGIENFSHVIRLKPDKANGYDDRGDVYCMMKDYSKAINDYKNGAKYSTGDKWGKKEHFYYTIARTYAQMNQPDSVYAYLEITFKENEDYVNYADGEREFDNIKNEPRFKKLLAKYSKE